MRRAFSVSIFARFGGRVLLIHHHRLDAWLPPGGELQPGETPLEAAVRELREETGLEGRFPPMGHLEPMGRIVGAPQGLIGYEEHPAGSKGIHMNFAFACDVDAGEVRPNHEFARWCWATLDDGPWDGAPTNVRQLAEVALAVPRP